MDIDYAKLLEEAEAEEGVPEGEKRRYEREPRRGIYIEFPEGHPCYDYAKYFSAISTKRVLADEVCPLMKGSGIFEKYYRENRKIPAKFKERFTTLDEMIDSVKALVGLNRLKLKGRQ